MLPRECILALRQSRHVFKVSSVSKTLLAENSGRASPDVHSPKRIFANSFRLYFPPSSRIRSVGRVTSPRCLLVEQYFRSVSARPFAPSHVGEKMYDDRRDVIVYARSNFGRLLVFVDRRPLSLQLCYIAKLVLFTRLDNDSRSPWVSERVPFRISFGESCASYAKKIFARKSTVSRIM